jgi:cysteine desulfurase
VLAAMRVDPEIAVSTIRVSLGWSSSEAEIDHFLCAWSALYRRCRGLAKGARAA